MPWFKKQPICLDDCDFVVYSPSSPDVLGYYERLRGYVEHEDELINSRLTWSLTVHGFLFAAFGLIAGKVSDILLAYHQSDKLSGHSRELHNAMLMLMSLLLLVAFVGAVVGYLSRKAIRASHYAIQHLHAIAHSQGVLQLPRLAQPPAAQQAIAANSLLLPCIIGGGDGGKYTEGAHKYYLYLPVVLTLVWILIFGGAAYFLAHSNQLPF